MRLRDKTAIVTGAGRGIGRACALRFATEGADLVLADVCADVPQVPVPLATAAQLAETAELCREQGAAVLTVAVDVRDTQAVIGAVEQAVDRFGAIDVLLNAAGIAVPSGQPVHETTESDWAVHLDINLSGPWRMTRAVVPGMITRRSGSVVNVASTAGLVGYRHFAGYVAAKHGLVGLSRAAALDYASFKVRVNAICPGSVRDDPLLDGRMLGDIARALDLPVAGHERTFLRDQPTNSLVAAEDVAATAVWLASDESRHVTGSVVTVDGGFSAR